MPVSDEPRWWPWTRDVILFVGGLAGVAYETLFASADRPELLILFAGMMGLPYALHKDEKK